MKYVLAGSYFDRYETKHVVSFMDDEDMSQDSERRALCGKWISRNGKEPALAPDFSSACCNICAALFEREKIK